MILRLAATMDLPLRQQNALMLAAGYASAWQERDLSTPDLAVVNSALDYMLAQHEPYRPSSSIAAGPCCTPTAARRT